MLLACVLALTPPAFAQSTSAAEHPKFGYDASLIGATTYKLLSYFFTACLYPNLLGVRQFHSGMTRIYWASHLTRKNVVSLALHFF